MLNKIWEFILLEEPNVRYVVFGNVIIAISSSLIGTFAYLRKRALVGDAVSHSVLPGVCLGFLVTGSKNPFALSLGAFVTGWLCLMLIERVSAKTKLKEDAAIGGMLSFFFAIGLLLLTTIQHSGNASQAGLDHFLFGKAAALVGSDLLFFGGVAILLTALVILFYKEFKLMSFDLAFARSIGYPVRGLNLLLTTMTVVAVIVGIQSVGVVLMAALLITPVAAARFLTQDLKWVLVLSAFIGAIGGWSGVLVSYLSPSMPTGPWVVLSISIIAILVFLFSPSKGVVAQQIKVRAARRVILTENILKAFYKVGEKKGGFMMPRSIEELHYNSGLSKRELEEGMAKLRRQGYVERDAKDWVLTMEGLERGKRVVRLHRLWELYLTEYMNVAPDHVHDDAELIEHIITPEIEKMLEEKLDKPTVDPHSSEIPK